MDKEFGSNRLMRHVVAPAVVPALFFAVAAMPVDVLGCRTRGLLAVSVAMLGALAALGAALKAVFDRARGRPLSGWWVASALVLSAPAAYVAIIA